jgi:hypothetical protein
LKQCGVRRRRGVGARRLGVRVGDDGVRETGRRGGGAIGDATLPGYASQKATTLKGWKGKERTTVE